MGGTDNLRPFGRGLRTEDEERALQAKGGKRSGETRRRKKQFRDTATVVLGLKPEIKKEKLKSMGYDKKAEPTIQLVTVLSIAQKAMLGDVKAAKLLMEMVGEDPHSVSARDRIDLEYDRMMLSVGGALRNREYDDAQDARIDGEDDPDRANGGDVVDLSKLTDDELTELQRACEMVRQKGGVVDD